MKKLVILVLSSLLMACSAQYTSNGEQHYLRSKNGLNLVIPPPLTSANISHFYDLPPQNQNADIGVAPPGGVQAR